MLPFIISAESCWGFMTDLCVEAGTRFKF
uniref:Uncharacterized protein n=1 Tax=Rhizophora mucronata TaxID=61149 RepID=A0A2P2R0M2_RHIMU